MADNRVELAVRRIQALMVKGVQYIEALNLVSIQLDVDVADIELAWLAKSSTKWRN